MSKKGESLPLMNLPAKLDFKEKEGNIGKSQPNEEDRNIEEEEINTTKKNYKASLTGMYDDRTKYTEGRLSRYEYDSSSKAYYNVTSEGVKKIYSDGDRVCHPDSNDWTKSDDKYDKENDEGEKFSASSL